MRQLAALLVTLAIAFSCKESGRPDYEVQGTRANSSDTQIISSNAFQLEPALEKADSLQILYFDEPEGDSSRYMRFFTYTNLTDSASLTMFRNNLNSPFSQQQVVRECRSEGKIYVFANGRELKTIYFSTKCDVDCCYIYFIKNGLFNYFRISDELKRVINEKRKTAKKP